MTKARFVLASSLLWVSFASAQPIRKVIGSDTAGNEPLRLYLSPIRVDGGYRLTPNAYSGATHVQQIVDFRDLRDSAHVAPVAGVVTRAIDTWNGVQFVSPQLAGPFELSGRFSGHLDFITNTPDFDFQISLYELRSNGDYSVVSTYSTQDAAARDSLHRPVLQAGARQQIDYHSARPAKQVVHNGSKLVVLITILRQPARQIDDTTEPLKISWYGESYVAMRVRTQ